jgi:hypothetical protein
MSDKTRPTDEDYIAAAKRLYADPSDDDIEISNVATTSQNDDGCWVSAWVYVRDTDVPDFEENDDA